MNKRVYGVLGIRNIMANWNADFTGYPRTTSTGDIFGSDKAIKFPIKQMWAKQGKQVLFIKSYKIKEDKKNEKVVIPQNLKERYEQVFECKDLSKEKDNVKVVQNLYQAIDVKNFGAAFAEKGKNTSITGAVQIGQGYNKYLDAEPIEMKILSPFQNANEEDAKNSSVGTKIILNEAHYFYPFVINPKAYCEAAELGLTDGYTEEDYAEFKKAALVAATSYNSNSKMGCENEFAIFIETDEELYLPELTQYISFRKDEETGKDVITLGFAELLNKVSGQIKNIEIYYDHYKAMIENPIEGAKYYNIFTREELSVC